MQDKYLIKYKEITKRLQTKQQIMNLFNIPLYIVNKVIQKTNNIDYKTKANLHGIYNEFYNDTDIYLIKPTINKF